MLPTVRAGSGLSGEGAGKGLVQGWTGRGGVGCVGGAGAGRAGGVNILCDYAGRHPEY